MSTQAKTESNLRRIQDFMANYALNYEQIALWLCCFLPAKGQITLAIDRTNWQRPAPGLESVILTFWLLVLTARGRLFLFGLNSWKTNKAATATSKNVSGC